MHGMEVFGTAKSIKALLATLAAGILAGLFGGFINWPGLGTIAAIAVMGAFLVESIERR